MNYIGELAGLATAVCWVICSMCFEEAGRRIGPLPLNIIRLAIALVLVSLYSLFVTGHPFPSGLSTEQWLWLSASGIVGYYLGDITLFKAFTLVGARTSMVIYSTVPIFTALFGFLVLGETMHYLHISGMLIAIGGVIVVVASKNHALSADRARLKAGIIMALLGTLGQAGGMILSKKGMTDDPFIANQVRSIAALAMFMLTFTLLRRWNRVRDGLRNGKAMSFTAIGAFFGPFIGVSLSLLAIQHTSTGIASTLIGLSPILIIPPSIIFKKETVNWKEVLGTFIAIGGSSMLFIKPA